MLFIVIGVILIFAVVGGVIGNGKGKTGKGFLLGLILGPIGWVLALFDAGVFGILLTFVVLGALFYVWLRVDQVDKDRAMEDRFEEADLKAEQDLSHSERAGGLPASPKPITAMLDLEEAFQKENPGDLIRDPVHDVSHAVRKSDTPPTGELDYTGKDGREIRFFFAWVDNRWHFKSTAARKKSFFLLNENEPGSETSTINPAVAQFFAAHGVEAEVALNPGSASPGADTSSIAIPTATPTPEQIAAQRARAQAAEIARKYGNH